MHVSPLLTSDSTPTADENEDAELKGTVSIRMRPRGFLQLMRMTSKGNKAQAKAISAAVVSSAPRQEKRAKAGSIEMEQI